MKTIGNGAFRGCTGLINIEIPNSVTEIGDFAFEDCTGLTSIEIPNSVTKIDFSAFGCCEGLTSIEIPNSVTKIGYSIFSGCKTLTFVCYNTKEEKPDKSADFINRLLYSIGDDKLILYVPIGTGYAYRHFPFVRRIKEVILEK